jgi:hypothetical protein
MKSVRALGAMALVIAILAAGAAVCPCAEHPSDRGHDCCARGTALRASGHDCCARTDAALGVASSVEGGLALPLAHVVSALPGSALAPHDAIRHAVSPVPTSPPTVLRI